MASASWALLASGCRQRGHQAPRAQHGDAVAHAQHFVQLVADEDDGQSLRHHLRQRGKEAFALLRREHGRGLVQDQDARAAHQRLEDFHALAFAHRQIGHAPIGVDLQAEARTFGHQALARGGAAREGLPQAFGAQHHVVQHAQVVGQREVLVHHADAGVQRGARLAGWQRAAFDFDVPGIGHVVPEEDAHQRALAGTVFAQQGQHLAARQVQRDVVVGAQRAEGLADARQAKGGREVTGHARILRQATPPAFALPW
jgi:hypothetical protein